LVNGVFWDLDMTVPSKEKVDFVGEFKPFAYGFRKNEYWDQKQLKTAYFLSITATFYIKKAPHKMRSFVRAKGIPPKCGG
jgi:hypothetical protein